MAETPVQLRSQPTPAADTTVAAAVTMPTMSQQPPTLQNIAVTQPSPASTIGAASATGARPTRSHRRGLPEDVGTPPNQPVTPIRRKSPRHGETVALVGGACLPPKPPSNPISLRHRSVGIPMHDHMQNQPNACRRGRPDDETTTYHNSVKAIVATMLLFWSQP